MLGAAVLAGGMLGNAGIVSAADPDPTAMYKGGVIVIDSPISSHIEQTGEKLEIKAYNLADVLSGEYKAYTSGNFYGAYVIGVLKPDISIVTGGNVIMTGGTVGYIYGGFGTDVANVSGNYVYITGNDSVVNGSVYGGNLGSGDGNAENNEVNISSGSKVKKLDPEGSPYAGAVFGGIVNDSGNAENNRVNILESTVEGDVYGGSSASGNAVNNRVNISDSTIGNNVYGGYVKVSGNANSNIVNISGGGPTNIYGGFVSGSGNAENNRVNIAGGTIGNNVYGGYTINGNANSNIVNISGGKVNESVYGGYVKVSGNAENNRVNISGSTVLGYVYGGFSASGANVSGNTVVINNSTVDGEVYGGKIEAASGKIENNTVIIGGGSKVTRNVYANGYGADAGAGTVILNGAEITGTVLGSYAGCIDKTLNICSLNNKVNAFSSFDTINFYVPKDAKNNATMLTTTSGSSIDLANVKTIRAGVANWSTLKKGDVINLLVTGSGLDHVPVNMSTTNKLDGVTKKAEIISSSLVELDGTVEKSGNNIVLKINEDVKPAETTKSLVETRAGEMAFLNNAADLATGKGFLSAQAAAEAETNKGYTTFAAISAADMRYETGSYVDSKGWGLNVGFARIINKENSKLTLAPLVEYGRANYASFLNDGTRGDGYNQYLGLGFMAKDELKNGTYYEGSVRFGHMKGDYNGDANTDFANYDTDSNYLAFHAGVGKVVDINADSNIDYYGKFFYTHQTSDTVDIRTSFGDTKFDFDSINSYRTRLGARWNKKLNARDTFYAGLAWDYEFDSEARASFNGMAAPSPTMKGSSGLLELGWKMKASKENPVSVDLGLNGWVGKQRGVSFNAGFSWEF